MTPEQIAKSDSEHGHQSALFAWAAMAQNFGFDAADDVKSYSVAGHALKTYGAATLGQDAIPELKWFFAIPNGGSRGDNEQSRVIRGGQLKAEGVKPGVHDTLLPVRRGGYCGLFVEMKKPQTDKQKAGKLSDDQKEFGAFVQDQDYGWVCCYTWRDAANMLKQYLLTS